MLFIDVEVVAQSDLYIDLLSDTILTHTTLCVEPYLNLNVRSKPVRDTVCLLCCAIFIRREKLHVILCAI